MLIRSPLGCVLRAISIGGILTRIMYVDSLLAPKPLVSVDVAVRNLMFTWYYVLPMLKCVSPTGPLVAAPT